jgi:type II secretory pathway component PulF
MALYYYQALSKEGKKQTGHVDASSLQSAREQIARRGLYIVKISLADQAGGSEPWYKKLFSRSVSTKDKILFTKQLAVLLKSGVPLLQSLELLTEQFEGKLRTILVSLKDGIKEGKSLADGLKKYPKVFDTIYVQLVRAGEATGKLEVILERLTSYLERKDEIKKKIKGAISYPLVQLGIVALVVVFLLTYVVPQIAQTFKQKGGDLPTPTKIMIAISNFIRGHYLILIIIIISIIVLFKYWKSTTSGSRLFDKIKLRLPLIRYFAKTSTVVQFSRTLGMLLESGVNLSEALDIVVNIIDNKVLADSLMEARDKIIKQGKIAQFLKQTNIFPPIATYLINTGEQTGELDYMLLTVAQNYEVELSELTDSLTAKIEPLMMVVMAFVVGFIVMSIALPLMKMNQLVGGM